MEPQGEQLQDNNCSESFASLDLVVDVDDANGNNTLDKGVPEGAARPMVFRSRQIAPMMAKGGTAKMWVPDSNDSLSSLKLKDVNDETNNDDDKSVDLNHSNPELHRQTLTPMAFRSRPIAPMMLKSASVNAFLPDPTRVIQSAGPRLGGRQMNADLKAKCLLGPNMMAPLLVEDNELNCSPEESGKLYQLRRENGFKDLGLLHHIEKCCEVRQNLNNVGDPEVLRKEKIAMYMEQFKREKPRGKQTHGLSEVEVKTQRANLKPVQTKQLYGLCLQEEHSMSS